MIEALQMLGLHVLRGEIYLALGALFLLLYGAYRAPKADVSWVLGGVLVLAFSGFLVFDGGTEPARIFSGMLLSNGFTVVVKILIVTASILALMLATDWLEGKPFEYVVLMLLAALGMMLMVSSGSLLAFYMALELMSLPLYVLASFDRDGARSTEAGLKYFILGSLASGMILFGASLLYGFSGTVDFSTLAHIVSGQEEVSRALLVGMILVMVGICFKLSAAPFHMWAPDVYEGAPTPVAAFFATAPKIAAMGLFAQLLFGPFAALIGQWQQVVLAAAVLSMLVGGLGAIMQTNIKRLLAYSSIGHVGFMLLGFASGTAAGVQAVLVYLMLYLFMSAGMFACVLISGREQIKDFAGLAKTHPWLAAAIAAFMFSMGGIPPLSGFFGKFYVGLAALQAGLVGWVIVAVLISVVAMFYYLKLVKVMYFDEPVQQDLAIHASPLVRAVAVIGVAVTLFFCALPTPVISIAKAAATALVP